MSPRRSREVSRFPVAGSPPAYDAGSVTLHDWIDELCDVLDIDAEIDEGLVLDVARDAAHNVVRQAAPITTYLLGYAAAQAGGNPEKVERLAAAASALAERWGGADPTAVEDPPVADELDEALVDAD
jgi:hypothetical protein